jgi:molybdopterin adenylyltransferase
VIPEDRRVPIGTRALVLTVSDGVANGTRHDDSGQVLADRLGQLGFTTERATVPDDRFPIENALRDAVKVHALVVTTGGTGLTPRDVTPQATAAVLDYEVPGLAEAMRAEGRRVTPMADLSRGLVGVSGRTLIVNVPGSPKAALESIATLEVTLRHALETLAGAFDHGHMAGERPDLPDPGPEGAFSPTLGTPDEHDEAPPPSATDMDPWRDLPPGR